MNKNRNPRRIGESDFGERRGKDGVDSKGAWDVVVLSFKLLFQRINFWIKPNILAVVLSLPIITGPGAKAALYHTVAAGLQDPAGSEVKVRREMRNGFITHFSKALLVALLKYILLASIVASLYFWISQPQGIFRFVSVFSFYGLVVWWLSTVYLFPVLITYPDLGAFKIITRAVKLAFIKPFESLLFAVVRTLLQVLGIALLGPVLLIIPALRAQISIQGYWLLMGKEIPGFIPIDVYSRKKFSELDER